MKKRIINMFLKLFIALAIILIIIVLHNREDNNSSSSSSINLINSSHFSSYLSCNSKSKISNSLSSIMENE